MGVTQTVLVLCDCGCGSEVNYPTLKRDLEAEEWYRQNWRKTGARTYIPKLFFVDMSHEHVWQEANLPPVKGGRRTNSGRKQVA